MVSANSSVSLEFCMQTVEGVRGSSRDLVWLCVMEKETVDRSLPDPGAADLLVNASK